MPSSENTSLAQIIRDLRKRKKVTLQQLAAKIERSIGFVSQIERGLSHPSVEDLHAIGLALEVPSTYFVQQAVSPHQQWITRPGERRTLSYARGITDQVISPALSNKFVMLETLLEPGSDTGDRSIIDSVEQGGYVLEGELTLWINDEQMQLCAGDAFQIISGVSCRYANQGSIATKVLWVFS
jgi:transcriptional regulator with XRE-family HTH domain